MLKPFAALRLKNGKYSADDVFININGTKSYKSPLNTTHHIQEEKECFYICRISNSKKSVVGVVGIVDCNTVLNNITIKHEMIFTQKIKKLAESFKRTSLQVNPTLLIHNDIPLINDFYNTVMKSKPLLAVTEQSNTHEFWVIKDKSQISHLSKCFNNSICKLYIADGHHRIEALMECTNESNQYFLAMLVTPENIELKSYHRLLTNGISITTDELLNRISKYFNIGVTDKTISPLKGESQLYIKGQWYTLKAIIKDIYEIDQHDPIIIDKYFFKNALGIGNQASSNGDIDFIPGTLEKDLIAGKVDRNEALAALLIPPLRISEFMQAAQQNIILPPNSTYFEPKLINGLIAYKFR